MVRKSGKIALYEAIGESRGRLHDGKKPVQLSTEELSTPNHGLNVVKNKGPAGIIVVLTKPRIAIIIAVLVLLLLVSFKIGRMTSAVQQAESGQVVAVESGSALKVVDTPVKERYASEINVSSSNTERAVVKAPAAKKAAISGGLAGDNAIVVKTYQVEKDLLPVKEYYAKNGIDLEVVKRGAWYYLITKARYTKADFKNNGKVQKDLELIKKLGASYQAPADYDNFGSKPFQDAYAMKIR